MSQESYIKALEDYIDAQLTCIYCEGSLLVRNTPPQCDTCIGDPDRAESWENNDLNRSDDPVAFLRAKHGQPKRGNTLCTGERTEEDYYVYVVRRDVWQIGVKRWKREYLARNQPGQLCALSRQYAEVFTNAWLRDREMDLAEKALHDPRATPWRAVKVRVQARCKMPEGEPKPEDFAPSPGLMRLGEWSRSEGVR